MPFRRVLRLRPAVALSACLVTGAAALATAPVASAAPTVAQRWCVDVGGSISESSPLAVDLDGGGLDVVVGAHDGKVYALHGSDGSAVPGWPQQTSHAINSSPSAADTDGDGRPEVFVGNGTAAAPGGALHSFDHDGNLRFRYTQSDPHQSNLAFVAAPTLGDVNADSVPDVTAGALGLQMPSLTHTGALNPGWPFYTDDTVFSTAALTDVNGDGQTDIVVGGDASPGAPVDHRGGMVRAISGGGQLLWEFRINEIVRSSPAIGDITGDGTPEIVFGAGHHWVNQPGGASDATKVFALRLDGSPLWIRDTGGQTIGSPALADVNGDGRRDVVIGTFMGANPGRVFALNGTNGGDLPGFPQRSDGGVIVGGITTADFDKDGRQDPIVPGGGVVQVLSGANGRELVSFQRGSDVIYHNSPLATDVDGDGAVDLFLAGFHNNGGAGQVCRFEIDGSALGARGWHTFHLDARRTGSLTTAPLADSVCPEPGGGGYWMTASDGGIFSFCDAEFHGSTGNIALAQPIVGMSPTKSGNGYWLVARDGGIFAFGDAVFHGSTGAIPLAQPIVGMARTPSGNGYWLVARDGGIFAFGDAVFHGSTGAIALNQPIVGMTPTKDGGGYFLVASDGGVFAFGNAVFKGSTGNIALARPIVGMATTPSGNGYWMVASDGGIFAFGDAPFLGSTGAIALNQPIVSMEPTKNGQGYWLVATDGGIFAFGNAPFLGSTGGIKLNQPIVDMAAR